MSNKLVFFSNDRIIRQLINVRAKAAKKEHDRLIRESYIENHLFSECKKNPVYDLMPPRKTWKKLRYEIRNVSKTKEYVPIDSVEGNKKRIKYTINFDSKKRIKPKYYKELLKFISDQRKRVINWSEFSLKSPEVFPVDKPGSLDTVRPLCTYNFEDNVVLKEVNSYLTKKFDVLFSDCSFAFRALNKDNKIPSHHDTIEKILKYRKEHEAEEIYVAECDLQKFFDTINHKVIKECFEEALKCKKLHFSNNQKNMFRKIIEEYLHSYNFPKSVKSQENTLDFQKKHKGKTYKWIDEKILGEYYPTGIENECLGIPQGGPLSGLFANLVQNSVDHKIEDIKDKDLLYVRYCDDMIMLHTNKEKLKKALSIYMSEIKEKKLFIHDPVDIAGKEYSKSFYSEKSKLPYKWGSEIKKGEIPWISFVGYQIHFDGKVRVRRSSIKKEQSKQWKIVNQVISDIEKNHSKKSKFEVLESVRHRFIGMATGRANLYSKMKTPSLCWANGFKALNKNNYSLQQMKQLDRSRRNAFRYLYWKLNQNSDFKEVNEEDNEIGDESISKKNEKAIIYYGKPFSYYYWLENKGDFDEKK